MKRKVFSIWYTLCRHFHTVETRVKITSRLRVTLSETFEEFFKFEWCFAGTGSGSFVSFFYLEAGIFWKLIKQFTDLCKCFSMVIFLNVIQYFANIVKKSGIRLYCNIFVIVWYLLLSSPIYFPFRVFPDRVIGNSLRRDFIYKVSDKSGKPQWMQRVQDNNVKYRYLLMWGK